MSGAERRENLKEYSMPQLYDFKKNLSTKLEEIKVDIDKTKYAITEMKEELNALINSKKNKQAARRKILSEIVRRREERKDANRRDRESK